MNTLWIASYHSRHYEFEGTGTSRRAALDVLKQGLRKHAEQMGLDPDWWHPDSDGSEADDELAVRMLTVGTAYRDQAEL